MPRTIHADGRTVTVPDDATPEEVNQIFGPAQTTAPSPAAPVANKGLGTAWDTLSTVGSHLKNSVAGPYHAFTDPATPAEEKEFGGQDLSGPLTHVSLGAKRMFVDPSVRSIQAGNAARKSGNLDAAITNYAQALPIVGPMEKQAVETAQAKGALPALAGILTDLGVAKAMGKVADTLAAPAQVGEAMQESGLGRINRYLGTGPKDLRNGANPAQAVVKQVQGIPLTRGSLSRQLDTAAPRVGQQLGNVIRAADSNPAAAVPTQALRPAVEGPIFGRAGQVVGPAGSMNTGPLNTLLNSMEQPAPGVGVPVYGPNAPTAVAPTQLWNTIQNMDSNLKFSTDPEVEGVNEVGRDVRGGLRQQLETADPTIKPLSRQYGDIQAARDVLERKPNANSGIPHSLANAVGRTLNAAPVQVGLGKMANTAGGAISTVGKVLNPANTAGNIGNAAVVGSLGGGTSVVDQNASPDQGEVAQPDGQQPQENPSQNVQEPHATEATTPESPEATLKPLDHKTAASYYEQANGDPDGARELAAMDGYALPESENETNTFPQASIGALPGPVRRLLSSTGLNLQPARPHMGAQGNPAIASVDPGSPNTVNVEDPRRFNQSGPQTLGHEAVHLGQNNWTPEMQAQIPADDPKDPYGFGGTAGLQAMRDKGMKLWNLPREKAATVVQYYISQGGQKAPQAIRDAYEPWVKDLNDAPLSTIKPSEPDQPGMNTTARPPQGQMYSTQTFAKGDAAPGGMQKGTPVTLPDGSRGKVAHVIEGMGTVRVRTEDGRNLTVRAKALTVVPHVMVQSHARRITTK